MPRIATKLIERLARTHGRNLQRFFRQRLRRGSDADDLAQEVYLHLLDARRAGRIHSPEAYLFTVASRVLRSHRVTEQRQTLLSDTADEEEALAVNPTLDDEIDASVRARELGAVLNELPAKAQAAVVLAYHQGWTYDRIARFLGLSESAIKHQLAKALAYCRKRLAQRGDL